MGLLYLAIRPLCSEPVPGRSLQLWEHPTVFGGECGHPTRPSRVGRHVPYA
jgi:hypothetical protein